MTVAIAGGKGGTGKTTVATNLMAVLAESQPVILADLDVEAPNSSLVLNARQQQKQDMFRRIPVWDAESCIGCGQCQEVCAFNAITVLDNTVLVFPELCHGCYACAELCPASALTMSPTKMGELRRFSTDYGVFIEARLDIGQEQMVPLIAQTLDYVRDHFPSDTLRLLDSPPGTSCPVIETAREADFVVLVTEPTPFGLHDLSLSVEVMRRLAKPCGVVINRYGIGDAGVEEYCRRENIDILAKLPNDRAAAELIARQKLIHAFFPVISEQLHGLAQYISRLQPMEAFQ